MGQQWRADDRGQYFVDGISFSTHEGIVLVELEGRAGKLDVLFPVHRFMSAVRDAIELVEFIDAESRRKVAPLCAACDKRDKCPPDEH